MALSFMAAARADECVTIASATAEPDFTPCDFPDFDFNVQEAPDGTGHRTSDGTPWIAQSSKGVPLTVKATTGSLSVRTSLGTWRDYNVRGAQKAVEPRESMTPAPLVLPKTPAAPSPPLDIWSKVDVQGLEGAGEQPSLRTGIGADYRIDPQATVGVALERGNARTAAGGATEEDQKASAYVTLKAAPILSLDARTEWQAGNAEFAAANGASGKGAVILAPRLNHSFALDGGTTIEPFLTYKRELDFTASGREGGETGIAATQSAGAGLTYTKPDEYSLSVSADVDGLATEAQNVSSKFKLSVPIK